MAGKYREVVCYPKRQDSMTKSFTKAVRESIAWSQQRGLPIAKYDSESNAAYLEYADGSREYVTLP